MRPTAQLLALATLALCASAAAAQDAFRVRAWVEPAEGIGEDTPIRLLIEVEGAGNIPLSAPTLGPMKNLRVLSGPQSNFESVWSNGSFSSRSRLIYTLQAEGAGPAEVPAIDIALGNATVRTEPIRFEVAKSRGGVPPPAPTPRPPAERGGQRRDADVFIRAEIGSEEVWVGQSVPLSVSLYAAEQVLGFDWSREPALANFWVEELDVDSNAEAHRATVDGRRYTVFPMKRKVLVPQTPGEFDIEPYSMQIQVRQRSSDPFDLFSFGRGATVLRKTQPLHLVVRALPEADRPDDFSGAVGHYQFQAAFDRTESTVNTAVALKATLQGEGFLGAVQPPQLVAPTDLKVYPPKVSSMSRGVRGQMVSRKTWEWVLVPLAPGEVRLGELSFDYFDPATGKYEVAAAPLLPLVVQRGSATDESPLAHGEVLEQRRELAFIKPLRGQLRSGTLRAHERASFYALLLAPLLWVPLVITLGRHRTRLQLNLGLARSRRARARALKRFKAADRMLHGGDGGAFHEEVGRALVDYIADRFNRSAAGLTYEVADELLAERGLDADLRRRFRECLEHCDFARFVPSASRSDRREELLHEARQVMERLERAW